MKTKNTNKDILTMVKYIAEGKPTLAKNNLQRVLKHKCAKKIEKTLSEIQS